MIVRNRDLIPQGGPPPEKMLCSVMKEFEAGMPRLKTLREAYENNRGILQRQRDKGLPNNRMAHAFPRYIVTMAAGYLLGKPVSYSATVDHEQALFAVMEAYKHASVISVDNELAKDCGVYGRAVELLYANEQTQPRTAALCPENAFVVYDDSVENKPLFGVYFCPRRDVENRITGYVVNVYTSEMLYTYYAENLHGPYGAAEETPLYFGGVPMVEYWNSEDEVGDFEQVLSQIDAYDVLQSDRVNDKEQFVDALLVLTGCTMGTDEKGRSPGRQLREDRLLTLPDNEAKAEYLTHVLDESNVEILKNAIKADIHKFSMVPDLTDMQFAGNGSGVAMRYKLLGLENLVRVKESWFREGLTERLRRFAHFLSVKGGKLLDVDEVSISFSRGLPVNELEISQMVVNYAGRVPDELLLSQIPFVEDTQKAMDMLRQQKAEAVQAQRDAFGGYQDVPTGEDDV